MTALDVMGLSAPLAGAWLLLFVFGRGICRQIGCGRFCLPWRHSCKWHISGAMTWRNE